MLLVNKGIKSKIISVFLAVLSLFLFYSALVFLYHQNSVQKIEKQYIQEIQDPQILTNEQLRKKIEEVHDQKHREHYVQIATLLIFGILLLICSVIVAYFLFERILVKPLIEIMNRVKSFGSSRRFEKINIKSKDEFGELAQSFNQMMEDLQRTSVSKNYVDAILASMENMLIIVDSSLRIQVVNRAVMQKLGYSQSDLKGIEFKSLFETESLAKDVLSMVSVDAVSGYEANFVSQGFQSVPVLLSLSKLTGDRSHSGEIICIAQDMSRLKQAEKDNQAIQEQLMQAQKLESIGQLAGGIAHDFNNILTGIMGYASLLEKQFSSDKPTVKKLGVISRSAQRGADLVKKLLGFARKGHVEKTRLSLNAVIEETTDVLERTTDKTLEIQIDLDPNLQDIEADSTQILQVIMNLAVNARDALLDQGGVFKIITKNTHLSEDFCKSHASLHPGDYVVMIASDNGPGIPEDIRDKIFDPFFTTKQLGQGTGLGLSTVYGIVKQHHGEIVVNSKAGVGTEFQIYFPVLTKDNSLPSENLKNLEDQVLSQFDHTVLVADDEESVRNYLYDMLTSLGADVLVAKDGKEAVQAYQSHKEKIDLVILDVRMPQMTGPQAFQKIIRINPQVKVLFSSGYHQDQEDPEWLRGENVRFLPKPFSEQGFVKSLREFL